MERKLILADLLKGRQEFETIAQEVISNEDRRCQAGC